MLKFKNKFKFGGSGQHTESSSAEQSRSQTPESLMDTSKSGSTGLSKEFQKLVLGNEENGGEGSKDESGGVSVRTLTRESSTKSGAAKSVMTASLGTDGEERSNMSSNPGLLTVKIYNSSKVQLPIEINNDKQVLHTLASNASNESTCEQLIKNLRALADKEQAENLTGKYIPGYLASSFLPAIISIPNGDNLVKSLLYLTVEHDNNALMIEPTKGTVSHSTWNQVVSFDVTKTSAPDGQGLSFVSLNLFVRLPNILIPDHEKSDHKAIFTNNQNSNPNNIGDLLIGTIKVPLDLSQKSKLVRLLNHEYLKFANFNLSGNNDDFGELMLTVEFKPILKSHLSIDDFDLLKVIGKGSFGKVMQVVKKDTKQVYALKTIRKQHIISRMEVTHTLAERTVLARIRNPFIVPLKFSFQSPEKLYLVLSFINGGELFWHLQREGKFSMNRSRFYIAELLTALEALHDMNVIYRDLKPENILLDYQGHIALCDFGLCKLNMADNDKTNTFCGTPEYLAPELLLNQGYTRSVDWWTLGTLLYEMLTGLPPFYDNDIPTMYRKILQNPLKFPSFLEGTEAQDLMTKLLQKDPTKRLSDAIAIKKHPFFKDIDWQKLLHKNYLPPFKPNVESVLDTSNFELDFTNEKPQDSVVDDFLSESVQKQFGGWTYNGEGVLN